MAPILGALIASGLNLLAGAVKVKGKEFIEEKLGVNIEEALQSDEGKLKLATLEMQNHEMLLNYAKDIITLEHANTDSARKMNMAVQSSPDASWNAKNAAYLIDYFIVGATLGLAYLIFFKSEIIPNNELAYTAFGSLLTLCGTILNFHRGSSARSQGKDTTIASLTEQLK